MPDTDDFSRFFAEKLNRHLGYHQGFFGSLMIMTMSYGRFAAMVGVSTLLMYGMMYLNTYQADHIAFSQTRLWMAVVMGSAMAAVMMVFMGSMYKNKRLNGLIIAGSCVLFAVSLWLVRSQATVSDVGYMEAMIPHHSIAIMTSERAHIKDPRVRKLADGIIEAQVREIGEMKTLIRDLKSNPAPDNQPDIPARPAS